jgi:hypothetical protein
VAIPDCILLDIGNNHDEANQRGKATERGERAMGREWEHVRGEKRDFFIIKKALDLLWCIGKYNSNHRIWVKYRVSNNVVVFSLFFPKYGKGRIEIPGSF